MPIKAIIVDDDRKSRELIHTFCTEYSDDKIHILDFINRQEGILKNPKAQVFSKGINFEESSLKISFWIKDFNKKEKYKLIITNEIRKYVNNR